MQASLRAGAVLLVLLALLFTGPVAVAASVAPAPATFHVQVAGGSADGAVQAVLYFPGTTTIDEGDSITWTDMPGADETHTITFGTTGGCVDPGQIGVPVPGTTYSGSGCVSSGSLWPATAAGTAVLKSFTLTFPKAGTYKYFCQYHQPAMTGTVVVQPVGSAYPAGQSSYVASADPALAAAIKNGQAAVAAQKVSSAANADGTTTYTLNAGFGDGKTFSLYRYGANNLTIHSGDRVTWVQNDLDDFHTVTFLSNGQDIPYSLPNGQPNPIAVARTPDKSYTGTGLVNSGLLVPASAPAAERTYSLTFPNAGTFNYQCLIHDDAGMKGTIQVVASASLPSVLPKTGGASGSTAAAIGLFGLGLIGAGLAFFRRSDQDRRRG
jgi:LPXTG-motif cell wall-anchored protein